jgi:hypothetical protein
MELLKEKMIRTIMQSLLATKYYVVFTLSTTSTSDVEKIMKVNTTCFPSFSPRNLLF